MNINSIIFKEWQLLETGKGWDLPKSEVLWNKKNWPNESKFFHSETFQNGIWGKISKTDFSISEEHLLTITKCINEMCFGQELPVLNSPGCIPNTFMHWLMKLQIYMPSLWLGVRSLQICLPCEFKLNHNEVHVCSCILSVISVHLFIYLSVLFD